MLCSIHVYGCFLFFVFRYNVVANGNPGSIWDTTGRSVNDTKTLNPGSVVTDTINLDTNWLHENGPGAIICPAVAKLCAKYPGVFEFAVGGCGGPPENPGCSATPQPAGEDALHNAVFCLTSTDHGKKTVKAAFEGDGLVSYSDYIFANRQGLNSLRQHAQPIVHWN